jgi:hypothetical protein
VSMALEEAERGHLTACPFHEKIGL